MSIQNANITFNNAKLLIFYWCDNFWIR